MGAASARTFASRRDVLAMDAPGSVRSKDANGFLHVGVSNLTKEIVNPYYGHEIPGWEDRGLEPMRVYYGFRSGEELAKGAPTFSGLPLLLDHHVEDAERPQKEWRVGSIGSDARWEAPYVKASLTITDADAIRAVEDGSMKELSCAYRYTPEWTPGVHEGVHYDFIMRDIQGNHVALVKEGRAGSDVVVADARPRDMLNAMEEEAMGIFDHFRGAADSDPVQEKKGVDLAQSIVGLQKQDPETGEQEDVSVDSAAAERLMAVVNKISAKLEPEELEELAAAVEGLSGPAGDEDMEAATEAVDEDMEAAPEAVDEDMEEAPAEDEGEGEYAEAGGPAEDADEGEDVPTVDSEEEDGGPVFDENDVDGIMAAADKCGMDAEDPAFQAAFAEGVRYGEKRQKAAPAKLASEHESEGAKAAMDAALGKAHAGIEARLVKKFRALSRAAEDVRPVLGPVDALAFDSAASIYGAALRRMGIDTRRHPASAWRSMYGIAQDARLQAEAAEKYSAASRKDYEGQFAGLNRIKRG